MGLKPYLGLRGNALLRAAVMLVVGPTFTCYGYNMSVAGGLLTLDAFNNQFPRMDTIHTTGALNHQNSQIQGWFMGLIYRNDADSGYLRQAPSSPYIQSEVSSVRSRAFTWGIFWAGKRSSSSQILSLSLAQF